MSTKNEEQNAFERNVERLFKRNTKRELAERLAHANSRHAFLSTAFGNMQSLYEQSKAGHAQTRRRLHAMDKKLSQAFAVIGAQVVGALRMESTLPEEGDYDDQ